MRINRIKSLLTAVLLLSSIMVFAQDYDFSLGGINYAITSRQNKTVKVAQTYVEKRNLIIPSLVKIGGVTYRVTSIDGDGFYDSTDMVSITIPKSVTQLSSSIFFCCSSLRSIRVEPGNPVYDSRNNCNAIIETKTHTLICGCPTTKIPGNVQAIAPGAFNGCVGLTSLAVPPSVRRIGKNAFAGCNDLESITLPKHIANIKELGIPEGVTIIRR
jgi:hypothetical protein